MTAYHLLPPLMLLAALCFAASIITAVTTPKRPRLCAALFVAGAVCWAGFKLVREFWAP